MKPILPLLAGLLALVPAVASGQGEAAPFDTVSYAVGHQYSLALMAGKNDLMQEKKDFEEYVRGLDEHLTDMEAFRDSTYAVSYSLGGMQAIFLTDGRSEEENSAVMPCIAAGLRRVADGRIVLPDDTLAALAVIEQYADSVRPMELEPEARCAFFTAYGIMKAYQPGLQQYVDEMAFPHKLAANRQAYVRGMADLLETACVEPTTAYDLGRFVAQSVRIQFMNMNVCDKSSFLAGARAALWLADPLMPRGEVEGVFERKFREADGKYEFDEDGIVIEEMPEGQLGEDDVPAEEIIVEPADGGAD